MFIATDIGSSGLRFIRKVILLCGIAQSAEGIGQMIENWWCKLFHSHKHWRSKTEHIIGDANEEWELNYQQCLKCGRKWVYWESGLGPR